MKRQLLLGVTVLALLGSVQISEAQRGAPTRDERRAQRRQDTQNMTPEQRQEYFQQRMQDRLKNMTPEQRQRFEERRQQMEERMREQGLDPNDPNAWQQMGGNRGNGGNGGGRNGGGNRDENRRRLMIAAGIGEKEAQDAIIAFVNEQEQARQPLLQLARDAAAALAVEQPPVVETAADAAPAEGVAMAVPTEAEEAKVAAALTAYEAGVAQERIRYAAALKALDEKINYSNNPRVKSFLTLAGILDFDSLAMGGISSILAPSLMNQGGPGAGGPGAGGGGFGGGRNNRQAQLPEQP